MLRRGLAFLLVLPLLLPQGMCICDLLHRCEACTHSENEPADKAAACTSAGCDCCETECEAPSLSPAHTCHKSTLPEHRDDHMPCCPAKSSGQWRIEPVCAAVALPLLDSECVAAFVPTTPAAASSTIAGDSCFSQNPRYLTLLKLRI